MFILTLPVLILHILFLEIHPVPLKIINCYFLLITNEEMSTQLYSVHKEKHLRNLISSLAFRNYQQYLKKY